MVCFQWIEKIFFLLKLKYYLRFVENNTKNIILIGFMGSGKSTLGKKIAHRLGYDFLDTDDEIERMTGLKIPELFERLGEDHFRNLERTLLLNLKLDKPVVISCGGGLPCYKGNMDLLQKIGTVYYMKRSPKELFHRLVHSKTERPLLRKFNETELLAYIESLLNERSSYYEKAEYILERDRQTVDEFVAQYPIAS